jgi:peroxiredoxin
MFDPESPPEFSVSRWFNTNETPTLAGLKGRVVVMVVFQPHCPGCVKHSLPQAARVARSFDSRQVAVLGLNSAFEEHEKQTPQAIETFIANQGLMFPIAMDAANGADLPKTFAAYEIQGTPTTLVFDRQGRLRRHYLGQVDDMRLAAEVMALCIEDVTSPREASLAVEQRLAMALTDPDHHHHHEGGCCGGHHDHDHAHGEGCCGGKGHDHDHAHHHGHEHAHAQAGAGKKKGGCGNPECGCEH